MGGRRVKVYLDTCVLIYRVEGTEPYSQAVATAVRSVPDADFCISDLVRLECLVGPIRRGDDALRTVYERQFEHFTLVPLDRAVFELAAEFRARTSLRIPDGLHAAAAVAHGCDELWTNDTRLDRLAGTLSVRVVA